MDMEVRYTPKLGKVSRSGVQVPLRIDLDLLEWVDSQKERLGVTRNEIIRRALRIAREQEEKL